MDKEEMHRVILECLQGEEIVAEKQEGCIPSIVVKS